MQCTNDQKNDDVNLQEIGGAYMYRKKKAYSRTPIMVHQQEGYPATTLPPANKKIRSCGTIQLEYLPGNRKNCGYSIARQYKAEQWEQDRICWTDPDLFMGSLPS